jgi:hypothetical protein
MQRRVKRQKQTKISKYILKRLPTSNKIKVEPKIETRSRQTLSIGNGFARLMQPSGNLAVRKGEERMKVKKILSTCAAILLCVSLVIPGPESLAASAERGGGFTYVDHDSVLYTDPRVTIAANAELWLYNANPIWGGERLQIVYARLEIRDLVYPYHIQNVEISYAGRDGSAIFEYYPQSDYAGAYEDINTRSPYMGRTTFRVGTGTTISKISGGIARESLTMSFTPTSFLELPVPTMDDMRCELYTNSSHDGGPLHTGTVTISVTTCSVDERMQPTHSSTFTKELFLSGLDDQ